MAMIDIANIVVGTLLLVALLYVAIVSLLDEEKRAGLVALLLSISVPMPFFAVGILSFPNDTAVGILLLGLVAAITVVLILPTGCRHDWDDSIPNAQIDERDIMFSRRLLQPGTDRFDEYYARRPENKPWDDKFRHRPGLLATGATQYNPLTFSAAAASFDTIEKMRPYVEGTPSSDQVVADPDQLARFVKGWALKLGAHSVGITRLQEYHKYSVVGRGPDYGMPVELEHSRAIAITFEMDERMLGTGPSGPTIMESAQKYVGSGILAVQIADFIRRLGYAARAHIDGNYRVICPVVARDAGLGEIGRMGLLMTPDLAPRVRIAVVTTNMVLSTDRRTPDRSVLDFCERCRKCATCCPPWAIQFDGRSDIDGVSRWQIKQELCYIYWTHTGTDCGRCVAVCPYSRSSRLMHRFVRWGVRRSEHFRRIALILDSVFYGKKPKPEPVPEWMGSTS